MYYIWPFKFNFRGKSLASLNLLQEQVTKKISLGTKAGSDVAYWESLAQELKGFKAKVSLQEKHAEFLDRINEARSEAAQTEKTKGKNSIAKK